jgi:hypothetical protein
MPISILLDPELADSPKPKRISGFPSPEIVLLEFLHQGVILQTRALKMAYDNQPPIYKVILDSSLSNTLHLCWLQRQPSGWKILVGQNLGEHLKSAITTAIECMEI